MPASNNDIYIEQGADWNDSFQIVGDSNIPIDITGLIGKMQVRESATSTTFLAEATIVITDPVAGKGTRSISSAQTQAIPVVGNNCNILANYVYDFYLIDSEGRAARVTNGIAKVSPGVTR